MKQQHTHCIKCGKKIFDRHPRAKTCSIECGYELRSSEYHAEYYRKNRTKIIAQATASNKKRRQNNDI